MEVALSEVREFMVRSLMAVGTPKDLAIGHAELLLSADLAGYFSHGLNRLEYYVNDIIGKGTCPTARPELLKETPATALVDGKNGLGATTGNFCMDLACKKAKECGVGWVSARRGNHFGVGSWWAKKALRHGLIGMAFSNSSPLMVPSRAKDKALGTNPLALAAPGKVPEDHIVIDMATTVVAIGKIEMKIHEGGKLPKGWALGPDNCPTTDAKLAFKTAKLLPLGGTEETSGYKGFALATLVEIFCSGLSGSNPSHCIRPWSFDSAGVPSNLGLCFAAINPECFEPGFKDRLSKCVNHWRKLEPVDPKYPVIAPGDKEKENTAKTCQRGKIKYAKRLIDACNRMAKKNNIEPIKTLSPSSC